MKRIGVVRSALLLAAAAVSMMGMAGTASAGEPARASAAPSAVAPPARSAAAPPVALAVGGFYQIRNLGSNKCVDVSHKSTAVGAVVWQWSCHSGQSNQLWAPVAVGGGFYHLVSQATGFCLDIKTPGVEPPNGTVVQQFGCNSAILTESWRLDVLDAFAGTYRLLNQTGRCLDLSNGSTSDGARIQVLDCTLRTVPQQWRFV